MSLLKMTTEQWIDELASASPAPGGGSVAAMAAAMGAGLASMVCRLTIGKKKYAGVEADMQAMLGHNESLRRQLARLMDKDTEAFNLVMAAYGMPKETEADKEKRILAIESATKEATMVPLNVMVCVQEALVHSAELAGKGNTNALSDAGVFALMCQAGCRAAFYNVRINLSGLKDATFIEHIRAKADIIMNDVDARCMSIRNDVESRL